MKRFAWLALLWLSACPWRGVDDLVADANLVVVVAGVWADDVVTLETSDRTTTVTVTPAHEGELRLYEEFPEGHHDITLEHRRGDERRCARFEAELGAEETLFALDVRLLDRCDDDDDDDVRDDAGPDDGDDDGDDGGPPAEDDAGRPLDDGGATSDAGLPDDETDDAGVPEVTFVRLRLIAPPDECDTTCDDEDTRILEDGSIEHRDADGVEHTAALTSSELDEVVLLALSPEADLLFSGDAPDCPGASSSEEPEELERRVRIASGGDEAYLTERLDVNGCTGLAETLLEVLALARERASGADAGP